MLPEERRRRILAYLAQHGSARVSELSRVLGVSEMTVHRDLRYLAARGQVQRVRGGVLALSQASGPEATCPVCRGPVGERLRTVVVHPDRSQTHACCPHCAAILWRSQGEAAVAVLTRDFLYHRAVDVRAAYYVVGSTVVVCCQPSVLPFASEEDARRFARGFGGRVVGWEGVLDAVGSVHVHPEEASTASPE